MAEDLDAKHRCSMNSNVYRTKVIEPADLNPSFAGEDDQREDVDVLDHYWIRVTSPYQQYCCYDCDSTRDHWMMNTMTIRVENEITSKTHDDPMMLPCYWTVRIIDDFQSGFSLQTIRSMKRIRSTKSAIQHENELQSKWTRTAFVRLDMFARHSVNLNEHQQYSHTARQLSTKTQNRVNR
jgi:hypothetical protein